MSQIYQIPPLIGDSNGQYRIKISGNSGSGKTTLGKKLASMLNIVYISLDLLNWQPGWVEASKEEMRAKIIRSLDEAESQGGWVVDGNYTNKGGNIVWERATDVIWLDPPLILYFPRIFQRTMLRIFRRAPPCSPGCDETWGNVFFSRESILLWCLTNHRRNRQRNKELFKEISVRIDEEGNVKGIMRRMGGWGSELDAWLLELEAWLNSR